MIHKVIEFQGKIEGGAQMLSIDMNSETLESLIEECEVIKKMLNDPLKKVKDNIGIDWDYKINFYLAKNGVVTVGAI